MTSSFERDQSTHNNSPLAQDASLPRLFDFDLPSLQPGASPFPELTDTSGIHNVLDIASGNGEWTLRVAQLQPSLQLVGVERDPDLSKQAQAAIRAHDLQAVRFVTADPFTLTDQPEDAFDLVNARFIIGMLPTSRWPAALTAFLRVTRPGGFLRLTETDLPITSSPAFEALNAHISRVYSRTGRSFSPQGRLLSVTPMLKRLLQDAGCADVRQQVFLTNFSSGMPAHDEVCQHIAASYQRILPLLIAEGAMTQPEAEQLHQQMRTEMEVQDFCATAFSLTVSGTKP